MKKLILLFGFAGILMFCTLYVSAQVRINTINSPPDNSAMLDVKSATRRFLPPRMNTAQRNAIASPAEGLVVYNTDEKALNVFNGSNWGPYAPVTCGNSFTDTRDGKTYNTVLIGTQCWFAQNLNIGTMVPGNSGQTNHSAIEKYCYNNDETYCTVYGGLYQWDNMMQWSTIEGVQGVCPPDWHIPTDGEWSVLTTFLGGVSVAGGKMKEAGYTHWQEPNTGATNSSGFTALPGGDRFIYGYFDKLTMLAIFWSSSQTGSTSAWSRDVGFNYEGVNAYYYYSKTYGFSARCLKNETPSPPENRLLQNITLPNGQSNCYDALQTITVAGNETTFIIEGGGAATLIAGQNILYLPGTAVYNGGYLWGYIAPDGPFCANPSMPAVLKAEMDSPPIVLEQSSFKIYPNPTTSNFILELTGDGLSDEVTVLVYGMWGEKVLTTTLNGERRHEFSLSDRPAGVYFILVITGDKVETVKIVKQ